jgi:hypothetical protein
MKKNLIVAAAMTGIIGAAINLTAPTSAMADDASGKCWGANSCKATGDCGSKDGKHACSGKNECKGKGWKKMSKADCEKAKAANKDKKIKIEFEA